MSFEEISGRDCLFSEERECFFFFYTPTPSEAVPIPESKRYPMACRLCGNQESSQVSAPWPICRPPWPSLPVEFSSVIFFSRCALWKGRLSTQYWQGQVFGP